jgi:hypothetical protein
MTANRMQEPILPRSRLGDAAIPEKSWELLWKSSVPSFATVCFATASAKERVPNLRMHVKLQL